MTGPGRWVGSGYGEMPRISTGQGGMPGTGNDFSQHFPNCIPKNRACRREIIGNGFFDKF